jgi:hypothetical protein
MSGTSCSRCVSNQCSERLVANSLTRVGLRRASIEPPISVRLRGWGSPADAISDAAASTGTAGWQTASTCNSVGADVAG